MLGIPVQPVLVDANGVTLVTPFGSAQGVMGNGMPSKKVCCSRLSRLAPSTKSASEVRYIGRLEPTPTPVKRLVMFNA